MNTMQKYLFLATSGIALTAPGAYADGFDLSEKLSVTGFIDMSTVYYDPDSGDSETSSNLDQFEIDLLYDFGGGLSAQVDLEYQDDDPDGDDIEIEQAIINYAFNDNFSVKAGRFLSYSGWETEEPTGLYQYSGAGYAKYFYGFYQQGVSAKYTNSMFDFGVSVVNSLFDPTETDSEDLGLEFMAAFHPVESWVTKAFFMTDSMTDDPATAIDESDEDFELINIWTGYFAGPLTLAAEYNTAENTAGYKTEADGYLLMANYAWEKFGLTFRYHSWETETDSGTTLEEIDGFTISPSYKVNDNLLVVTEFRTDEDDVTGDEWNTYALELLLTF